MAPERLFVYRPGAIGDFILALPALAALRARFPDATLVVAGPAAALPLARASGLADVTLSADDARLTPLFSPGSTAAPPDLRPSHAVVWAGAAGAALAENLRALGAAVVHAPSRPPAERPQHVADYLIETLRPLGVEPTLPAEPRVAPGVDARARAAAFLAEHEDTGGPPQPPNAGGSSGPVASGVHSWQPCEAGGAPSTHWVALHVGSGSPRKNWAAARWAAVAEALAGRGSRLLLVAGPAEGEAVQAVAEAVPAAQPVVMRDWPLEDLAALLARCAGYVGGDSGITHLAAAVGTPVVAVFGPTDPAVWAPRGPQVAIVRHRVPCQPCTWEAMWACSHRACLADLTVDAVVDAVARLRITGSE
jgi:heptosyltransferase III